MKLKKYVIIVGGGKGLRMGMEIPKQFIEINGKPIIIHTLEKFTKALPNAELLLVLPQTDLKRWEALSKGSFYETIRVAIGGNSRFDSVKSGLSLIREEGIVGIHDAVRPLVSEQTIQRVFQAAVNHQAVIPVVELKDSIRQLTEKGSKAMDRSAFRLVQTPQCFQSSIIQQAYQREYDPQFTDDASLVESIGEKVHLVEGNVENIKLTTKEDLILLTNQLSR